MEIGGPRTTRFTREELYELVWTEPMQALAPRFGISDVALKKRCLRMRIPTPGRGYWAKKAAGVTQRRPALPKLPNSVPASIMTAIFTEPPKPRLAEEEATTGPVADQARYEAVEEHRIVVPELLADPHPLVAASIHLLRKSRTDAEHVLVPARKKCLALSVTLGTADRATLIFDTLIKALEARGFSVALESPPDSEEQGTRTMITLGLECIPIAIAERIDRTERKPDPQAKHPIYGKQWEYLPTGRLSLYLLLPYLGTRVRSTWSDGSKQRVETRLNDVVVGLVAAAEAIKLQRLEQEARHREYLAEQEREQARAERRQQEAGRVRALGADLKAWRRCAIIREYAAAMRSAAEAASLLGEGSPMAAWLQWVDAYANRVDPMQPTPTVPADPEPHHWYGSPSRANADPEILW
jgi:hypothetical protein